MNWVFSGIINKDNLFPFFFSRKEIHTGKTNRGTMHSHSLLMRSSKCYWGYFANKFAYNGKYLFSHFLKRYNKQQEAAIMAEPALMEALCQLGLQKYVRNLTDNGIRHVDMFRKNFLCVDWSKILKNKTSSLLKIRTLSSKFGTGEFYCIFY